MYIFDSQAKKSKVCQHFLLAFIIIRLIVESRLSGFLRKFNEFSKAYYHNLFFGLGTSSQGVTIWPEIQKFV